MIENILKQHIPERFVNDERYRRGHIRVINPLPGTSVLGLHIPDMRKVASQLAASDDAVGLIGQFEAAPERSLHYEEYMVWGMMLNRIKLPLEERLERVRAFVPHIDNWAVCDCVCADARWARPDGRTWDFIRPYLSSGREFEVRFGLILYMSRMMEESSLPEIFKIMESIDLEHIHSDYRQGKVSRDSEDLCPGLTAGRPPYYVRMGMAWARRRTPAIRPQGPRVLPHPGYTAVPDHLTLLTGNRRCFLRLFRHFSLSLHSEMKVRAKKRLGQHFLNDESIAHRIVESLLEMNPRGAECSVLEVGPGMGVLTKYLLQENSLDFRAVEIDGESVEYLAQNYPAIRPRLYEEDFLRMDLGKIFPGRLALIGNFPYNISSQIFFKILEDKDRIPFAVGMVQKEVADRLASPPGNKAYGILSVLLQAWYDIEYLFTVEPGSFNPPPKVRSAVIRIKRNDRTALGCDEVLFKRVVKTCFNMRRKTIRNSIKPLLGEYSLTDTGSPLLDMRPEQLSVEMFVKLSDLLKNNTKIS